MSISAILFLVLYFVFLIRAFTNRPLFGLYAYLLAFYAFPQARWWGSALPDIRWSLIAAVITLFAILLNKNKEEIILFKFKETKLFFIFSIFVVLQSIWAINFDIHMLYVVLVIKYCILIFLIQNSLKSNKDTIGFIVVNLIGCGYFAYLGMATGGGRLEGIGGPGISSANQLSQHLIVVLIFSSYLLFMKWGWKVWILIALIVTNLNTIMHTESRGAIVSLIITGLLAIKYIPAKHKKQFLMLAGLGAVAFSILLGPQIIKRFDSMKMGSSGKIQDKSAQSRIAIIKSQIEMVKDKPFLGHGHRSTLLLSPFYIADKYRTRSSRGKDGVTRRASHNFLMGLLVDHGIIGTLLYVSVIILCLKRLFYLKRISKEPYTEKGEQLKLLLTGFTLSLFCFMVSGLFSNHKVNEIDIWLYAIIPLLHSQLQKQKMENKDVT